MKRLLLLTVALPLAACAPTPIERIDSAFSHVTPIILSSCEELGSYRTTGDLEAAFGTPLQHVTRPVPNQHVSDQVDEWHDVKFDVAEAGYLVSKSATRPIMVHFLRIFAENVDSEIGRLINQPIEDALALLGPPDIRSEDSLLYYCGEVNSIKLELAEGAVLAVLWQPYTG